MPEPSPKASVLTRPAGVVLLGIATLAMLIYLIMPNGAGSGFAPLIKAMPIWILAVLAFQVRDTPRHLILALALVLSGFGDVFLSLDLANSFAFGMGAFLLAQLAYIACFWPRRRSISMLSFPDRIVLAIVVIWAAGLGLWLVPLAGAMAPALMAYFGTLSLMVLLAIGSDIAKAARAGALLFFLSDSLIGIDRFAYTIPERHLAIMGSYYLAQFMLFWGLMHTIARDDG